ncbi:MAG: hypothetical protein J07HR59_00956, partial [Halorubrum sp. J07HR59]
MRYPLRPLKERLGDPTRHVGQSEPNPFPERPHYLPVMNIPMSTLLWVIVGVLGYTVTATWLQSRGVLPDAVNVSGPTTTISTTRGRAFLDRLSAPKRAWRILANLGVGGTLVIMVGAFLTFLLQAVSVIANPPEPTGVNTPQNVLVIPGVNDFL